MISALKERQLVNRQPLIGEFDSQGDQGRLPRGGDNWAAHLKGEELSHEEDRSLFQADVEGPEAGTGDAYKKCTYKKGQ